jgi:hypothetical protein
MWFVRALSQILRSCRGVGIRQRKAAQCSAKAAKMKFGNRGVIQSPSVSFEIKIWQLGLPPALPGLARPIPIYRVAAADMVRFTFGEILISFIGFKFLIKLGILVQA